MTSVGTKKLLVYGVYHRQVVIWEDTRVSASGHACPELPPPNTSMQKSVTPYANRDLRRKRLSDSVAVRAVGPRFTARL